MISISERKLYKTSSTNIGSTKIKQTFFSTILLQIIPQLTIVASDVPVQLTNPGTCQQCRRYFERDENLPERNEVTPGVVITYGTTHFELLGMD